MRNMSFALTTKQILAQTKTVTRRMGWLNLKAGDLIRPVVKGMGLKKGEKIQPIGTHVIRVVSVRREPLRRMLDDTEYGMAECAREGFPDGRYHDPFHFVPWFAASHDCDLGDDVTRIEFEYVSAGSDA